MSDLEGLSVEELFVRGIGITYDDFSVLDTEYTDIEKHEISLESELGMEIKQQTPIIMAPMDTVSNARACIAIAEEGAIGCLHYNYKNPDGSFDVDKQIKEIEDVKRSKNGFIENPITVGPEFTIAQALQIREDRKVGGSRIDTFPVTHEGEPHGKLLGMLRKQDYSTTENTQMKVKDRMVPLEKLIMGEWPIDLKEANEKLWDEHLLSLPIVDKEGMLMYLVTRSDLDKHERYPLANVDENMRLRVLFAVETWEDPGFETLERGFAAGADGCIVDTSQGFTKHAFSMLKHILEKYPGKPVIGGNIGTSKAAMQLQALGAHAYRIGQGIGSICTTALVTPVSCAGAAAVYRCASVRGSIPWADGGMKYTGDIMKALMIGARLAMLGNMLAGVEEGPGKTKLNEAGIPMKYYRGMGSEAADIAGRRGYARMPQGVEGHVEYKGSLHEWIPLIRGELISSMQSLNCRSIPELHEKVKSGEIRFERRTPGSMREARPHDIE